MFLSREGAGQKEADPVPRRPKGYILPPNQVLDGHYVMPTHCFNSQFPARLIGRTYERHKAPPTSLACLSNGIRAAAAERSYGLQSGELFDSEAGTGVQVIVNGALRC